MATQPIRAGKASVEVLVRVQHAPLSNRTKALLMQKTRHRPIIARAVFLWIFCYSGLQAQQMRPLSLGIDIAPLMAQLGGQTFAPTAGVQVLMREQLASDMNRRTGFGASLDTELAASGAAADLFCVFTSGKERFRDFERRWRAAWGWEFRSTFSLSAASGNARVWIAAGAAPVASVQYRLNERLSLATEAAFPLMLSFRLRNENPSIGLSAQMAWPTVLYLQYRLR